jgi:peptidoglycan/LPS O-acetylase OafA/YrhL
LPERCSTWPPNGLFNEGHQPVLECVDLFFVLSGFLIGGILLDHSQKCGFYRTFYIRRAARILPLYVLLLTLFFICRATLDHQSFGWLFNSIIPDFSYLSFTQNIFMGLNGTFGGHFLGVTWSLAVEEQFYLVIPLLLLIVGLNRFLLTAVTLAITAPFLRLAVPGFVSIANMPFRMDALLVGVILAAGFRSAAFVRLLSENKSLIWAVFLVLLLVMGVMTVRSVGHDFLDPSAIAIFYGTFISLALVYREEKITSVLRSVFLVKLGMYSYGLYMYHQMVAGLVHGYFRGTSPSMETSYGVLLTFASLVATGLITWISFHTLEAFALSLGRRYKYD